MAKRIQKKALRRTLELIAPDIKPQKALAAGGTLALLFEVAFRVLEPWPLKFVVDALSVSLGAQQSGPPASWSLLVWCGVALIAIVGLRALSNYLATVAFALVGSRASTLLRARVFNHVQNLHQGFHARNRSADTVQRIVGDVARLQEVAVTAGLPLIANLLTLAVMLIVMLVIDPILSLVVVVALFIFPLMSRGTARKITQASRRTRKAEGQLANTAQESLSSIKVVQAYGLEEHIGQRFVEANKKSLKDGVRARRLAARLERGTDVIVGISTAAVIVGGAWRVLENHMTIGDLVLFTTYLKTTMKPLRDMAKYTGRIARATASGERVADLMDVENDIEQLESPQNLGKVTGSLVFNNVYTEYDGHPVLRGLNLTVHPGEFVAVIGPSGAGKSTLVSLLGRSQDPSWGTVRIDDVTVATTDLEELRGNISLLHQEAVLFTATIRENIRYGRFDATDDEIEAAARAAHAAPFIEKLPAGYDTMVGERGGTLSGGQRQRIAIARALLRDTPIVVLDEATTGLDPESAGLVMDAIEELVKGKTTLAVTHDTEVALRADRVIWLQDGRVQFDGSPAHLLKTSRAFRAWVSAGEKNHDDIRVGD
ncbi:protein tyrosine phosphatase [Rothia nasimurium]|uniref:Protein tyrosine phosphatase n=1 Tax=Rothia nasimurium TaxID=85336 RepID=A0A1Y1RQW6_9MICC|nr:ABC transporter ATP-binding protein [Rothia nasimurium]ORC18886.1 protein tyrosine phosphatase [Rothia nasimurium]